MSCPTLYIHSYDLEYTSDPSVDVNFYNIMFPDDIIIPANTAVNVDMKIRIAVYCPMKSSRVYGLAAIPTTDIINTPLIQAIGCSSLTTINTATDLFIPVRNVSDSDYTITSGTILFSLSFQQYHDMSVRIVDIDHLMMQ